MRTSGNALASLTFAGSLLTASLAQGQGLSARPERADLQWQLQPFCDVVNMSLMQVTPGHWTMVGSDDRCGELAGQPLIALSGSCHLAQDSRVHCQWVEKFPDVPFGTTGATQFTAVIDDQGNGTWSADNSTTGTVVPVTATQTIGHPTDHTTAEPANTLTTHSTAQAETPAGERLPLGSPMTPGNVGGTPGPQGPAGPPGQGVADPNVSIDERKTAVGLNALMQNTGNENTGVGTSALAGNADGNSNTGIGARALLMNGNANSNTAIGAGAMEQTATGPFNTAVGVNALNSNFNGQENTTAGAFSLEFAFGDRNTALGVFALSNAVGSSNIAIGHGAGNSLTSGDGNLYIGNEGALVEDNTIRIGATHTSAFIAGIRNVTTGLNDGIPVLIDSQGQLGTVSSSRRFKWDIREMGDSSAALLRLRPVTFRYHQAFRDGSQPTQYGLIAEEVAEVFPDLAVYDADGTPSTVRYNLLPALLLNEVQKQQRTIAAQQQAIDELTQRLAMLERLITPAVQTAAAEK